MPESLGDAAQIRVIAEQIVEATIVKMRETEGPKAEIPAPLKWTAAIASAVMTAGVVSFCFWIVTTLNDMQLALRDVQTQLGQSGSIEARFGEVNRRIDRLEDIHKREAR